MKTYDCPHCGYEWSFKRDAEICCVCYICGQHTGNQPCDNCYADRQCDACCDIYDGENPEDVMHYGCGEEGLDEATLCHECWLDRQPALVQLGDCAE